jgi:1A family penicillin-binding protein
MPTQKELFDHVNIVLKPIFRGLLFIINLFIFIGEGTQWVVFKIFKIIRNFLISIFTFVQSIFDRILKIRLPAIHIRIPKLSRFNMPHVPAFSLPHVSLPHISIPHMHVPKLSVKQKKIKEIPKKKRFNASLGFKVKYFLYGLIFMLLITLIVLSYQFVMTLPNPSLIGKLNYPVSTEIFDRKGRLLYEIYHDQNRTPANYKKLPLYVKEATIAIEDKDFYHHKGISIFGGIVRAVKDMIITQSLQGGSTITQQLVKSALLTPERTVIRKIKEIILAVWTEQIYTKDQILESYLNQVPYGGSVYGVEEASQAFFNKKAENLTIAEAATLAGLPQAPTYYSPYSNPKLTLGRRNEVLKKMLEQKYISNSQYKKALNTPLSIQPFKQNIKAPHFVFYIKSLLEEEYGVDQVNQGGLRVVTSLDLDVQKKAEEILNEELKKVKYLNVNNGAILVTEPKTGEILAMVGSANYFDGQSGSFNDTTALRQPGSSIKPLMYSLALERGYTAATLIDDRPVNFNIAGSPTYSPVNYDGKFHGKVTLRTALANSYNIPAVKVLNTLGVDNFVEHAQDMGITTWNQPERYGLSLTLGGAEVKMTDMAVAFGVFSNEGKKVDLNPIESITDYKGNTLFSMDTEPDTSRQVISEDTAFIISNILSDNIARRAAFGPNSLLEIKGNEVAVKTGTTDEKHDNWTIGYTPDLLTSVWVGNNDNTPMNPYLSSGVTGAAPIWNRVMTYLLNDYLKPSEKNSFKIPDDIVRRTCSSKIEYFARGTDNKINCSPIPSLPLTSISPYMR